MDVYQSLEKGNLADCEKHIISQMRVTTHTLHGMTLV